MLAFIIAPFIIALLIIVFINSLKYLKAYKIKGLKFIEYIYGTVLFGGVFCVAAGFILNNGTYLKRLFTKLGYYWFGIFLYFFIGLAIALICRLIIWLLIRNKKYNILIARSFTIIFVLLFSISMSIYGINNAHKLRITNYEVASNKQSKLDNLNIVLIADLHLGYNVGLKEMEDMANKINDLNPDVVILAGDIFDNEYEAIENPEKIIQTLNGINAKYGKYATYGNHDTQEKLFMGFSLNWSKKDEAIADERMNKFIKDSGFDLLYDSYITIEDDIYVYGRPDAHKINLGNSNRKEPTEITEGLDLNKTIICVDHEPSQLDDLAKAGVDLDLSGHTHNGQFWPGTISIKFIWKNAYGMKQFNNMTSIVTSGVGLYGFNMRTGCYPEIVNINLKFKD